MRYLLFKNNNNYYFEDRNFNLQIKCIKPTLSALLINKPGVGKCDVLWSILTLNGCNIYACLNEEGKIVHTSRVVAKNFKYTFLDKNDMEIGPCFTDVEYRGKGIYPMVLAKILKENINRNFYMVIREDNEASIRGVQKAGFEHVGFVYKTRTGRWIKE